MTVLVDTSALLAILGEDDDAHAVATDIWTGLVGEVRLMTHTYVVLETSALVQRRMGMAAVERLHAELLPVIDIRVVSGTQHDRAVARWRGEGRRGPSLVDVTSFVVMEDAGIVQAFAFDDDFGRAGFTVMA